MKKQIILFVFCLTSICSFAQTKSVKELYDNFKVYRTFTDNKPDQIAQTLTLLTFADQLTTKQITNINYNLGRMYEDIEEADSAMRYYQKSLEGEPNYEVVHRALGFIYLAKSNDAVNKINEAKAKSDIEGDKKAFSAYKELILKALPHLEKYQACAPDDETLSIIRNLYASLKDTKALETLDARLKEMSGKCVDLLDDE